MNINFKNNKTLTLLIWGFALIFAAVFLILDNAGVNFGIELAPWRIILGALDLAWIIALCIKLRFTDLFFPLAFLFFIFEGPIASALGHEDGNLINNWIVLLAALMLTIGFKAIFSKHGAVKVGGTEKTNSENSAVHGKLGNSTVYIDAADAAEQTIHDNLGKIDVFFTNKEAYTGEGLVNIHDNLGSITVHVPSEWDVVTQTADNLGKINVPEKEASGSVSITLKIHNNLGVVNVAFE